MGYPPALSRGQTHACENITFPILRMRVVIIVAKARGFGMIMHLNGTTSVDSIRETHKSLPVSVVRVRLH